jgi:hypothetical protein
MIEPFQDLQTFQAPDTSLLPIQYFLEGNALPEPQLIVDPFPEVQEVSIPTPRAKPSPGPDRRKTRFSLTCNGTRTGSTSRERIMKSRDRLGRGNARVEKR